MKPAVEPGDREAVERCRAGESEAFEIVLRRYERRVFGLLYTLTSDPELARDLTQETFIRAWRKLDLFDPARSLPTWLFTIARNLLCDYRRRRAPITLRLGEEAGELSLPDPGPAPDAALHAGGLRCLVREALAGLPASQREVLVLKDIQELDYAAVADILGVPRGTIASRVHHARQALRRQVEGLCRRDSLRPDEVLAADGPVSHPFPDDLRPLPRPALSG